MTEIKLAIIGQDTLAAAARECCGRHFNIVSPPSADVIWFCYDTPIGTDGTPDSEWVVNAIITDISQPLDSKCIVVSSQLPVGTTARFEKRFPYHRWVHSPENIRVATALIDFLYQSRIVAGRRTDSDDALLTELFGKFTSDIIFTDPETAEMVKHSLNCWLAMNIAYINEIARVAAIVGADVDTITRALKTDPRVGSKAPLKAGSPFGGGHLARDLLTISSLARSHEIYIPIICSILPSNSI